MKRSSKRKMSVAVAAALGACGAAGQIAMATTAYSDNFNRTGINTGTYTYTTAVTAGDGAADVGATFNGVPSDPNLLTLTNDSSATAQANGIVYTSTPTSAYTGFNNNLALNTGNVLTWTLNMQDIRNAPSGFSTTGLYGAAVVLGATGSNFTSASGYAVAIGNSGSPDPIRLVKFTGGITTQSDIVKLSTQDAKTDYYSVKVTYDPSLNIWSLYTRDDGTSFADPTSGALTLSGQAIDTQYTNTALTHSGALWSYSTGAAQTSKFDNFALDISPPSTTGTPRNLTWDGNAGAGPNPSNISGNWDEATANWFDGTTNQTWNSTNPDNATFGTGAGTGTTTVTLTSDETVGSVTFAANSPAYTITGNKLTINGAALQGITANQSSTINSNIGVGAPQTWTVASGATMTIGDGSTGALSLSGSLTKDGVGTLLLNTPSPSFTGNLTINAGKVEVNSVNAGGVGGNGAGSITINNGGTFQIDNVKIGNNGNTGAGDVTIGMTINNGGTLIGTGANASFAGATAPAVPTAAGTVANIKAPSSGDVLTILSAVRNVGSASTSGAKIVVNGGGSSGRVYLTSGGTSSATGAGTQYVGSWELDGGTLQIGPSAPGGFGEPLNALGYQGYNPLTNIGEGPNGPTRPITLVGGVLAVGANSPNLANTPPIDATTFRSPVTIAGGAIASTLVDATYAGDITVNGGSVLTTDAVDGVTPRKVVIGTQALVNTNSNVVNGNIAWGNSTLTVNGAGTLSFERTAPVNVGDPTSAVTVTPGATLAISSGARVDLAGTQDALSDGTHHVNVTNNSTVGLHVMTGTKNVGEINGSGNTTVESGAVLRATHVQQNSLTMNGNVTVRENGLAAGTSKLNTLAVNSNKIDITNNHLILTSPNNSVGTWNGSAYTGTTGLIATGYGVNQDFSGPSGIVTSESNATGGNTLTSIGVASNSDLGLATFGGVSVGANDVLTMYTYNGDANLDGQINGDDYFQIDSAFPTNGHGWFNGDFNYDGVVNGDDYFIIDSNFPAQGPAFFVSGGLSGVAAVPEPASIGLIGLAASALLGRRRRSR